MQRSEAQDHWSEMPHVQAICFKDLLNSIDAAHEKLINENKRLRWQLAICQNPMEKTGFQQCDLSSQAFSPNGPIGDYYHRGFTPESSPRKNGIEGTPLTKKAIMASRSPRYDLKIPEQELQAIVDKAVDLAADVGMESKLPHESSRRAEASSAEGVHGDSQKASETTALGSVPSDATKTATKHATNQTGGSKLFTDMSEHRRMELQHKIDNQKHHKMKHEQQSRKNMFSFVHSDWFGMVSAVTILLNSAYIGIQGNAQVQWELKKVTGQVIGEGDWFAGDPLIGDLAFCIIFTVELILRVAADRNAFLFGLGMRWNLFDSFVVAASW